MDHVDKRILDIVQAGIPLEWNPYEALFGGMDIPTSEALERLRKLASVGVLSFIGPIYDTKVCGYRSTLIAMETSPREIDACAAKLAAYPGVSHCYERNHRFNLWSTVAVPPDRTLAEVVRHLAIDCGAHRTIMLPEVKRFKLRVRFDLMEKPTEESVSVSPEHSEADSRMKSKPVALRGTSLDTLRMLQSGIPLELNPFLALAKGDEERGRLLLEVLKQQCESGIVRRVAALVRHRRVGFKQNVMAVWNIDTARANEIGAKLAQFPQISHCYLRRRAHDWTFNLYAMTHGRSNCEIDQTLEQCCVAASLPSPLRLESVREFKKVRLQLYTKDYENWFASKDATGKETTSGREKS